MLEVAGVEPCVPDFIAIAMWRQYNQMYFEEPIEKVGTWREKLLSHFKGILFV